MNSPRNNLVPGKRTDASKSSEASKMDATLKADALKSALEAFKITCETITTVSNNRAARARIVADSEESIREYELRRNALQSMMAQTFKERNRTLDEYFRHLDEAMLAGDLEKAHVMTSNITDVVKSSPLTSLSDLRAKMMSGKHSFSIGQDE